VAWPAFPADDAARAIAAACEKDSLRRVCFQMTTFRGHIALAERAVTQMRALCDRPICVSIAPRDLSDIALLLTAGASRVTLAIDAACERIYNKHKSGSWRATDCLLTAAARAWRGRIGTHLIAGLGETEREMALAMQHYADLSITEGLFALTPVPGTRLANAQPPPLAVYRRLQAARWLIVNGLASESQFDYDDAGRIVSYGLSPQTLRCALSDPEANPFRTSGCAGCNRPYYNERPSGVLYNYPRPLTAAEAAAEALGVLEGLGASSEPNRQSFSTEYQT